MRRLLCLFVLVMLNPATQAQAQTGNTTLGTNAGESVTTGDYNSFFGERAGQWVTSGLYGTFLGYAAGRWQGHNSDNTCVGFGAGAGGSFITTDPDINLGETNPTPNGVDNVFVGTRAGQMNNATDNTFVGAEAGFSNTDGFDNTFIGEQAGYSNTTGDDNTFVGEDAGYDNTTGEDNTAVGSTAMRSVETGHGNTAVGKDALYDVTTGGNNTALGAWAGEDIGVGECNTTIGALAGTNTEYGDLNTFLGFQAGWDNNRTNNTNNANSNTYVGSYAGLTNREGSYNVIMGAFADFSNLDESDGLNACQSSTFWNGTTPNRTNFDNNVSNVSALGASIRVTGDNAVCVGYSAVGTGAQSITLGATAQSTHTAAVTIGYGATSHANNTVVLGNDSTVAWDPNLDGATALGSPTYRFSQAYSQNYTALAPVGTSANITLTADNGAQDDDSWQISGANSGDLTFSTFASGAYVPAVTIASTGDVIVAGDITLNSDGRLKQNVAPIESALDLVNKIEGVTYEWRPELHRGDKVHYGVIAQKVAKVLPELVRESRDGVLSVNYVGFIPVLINAVQELKGGIDGQKEQIRLQKTEIQLLREQVALQRALLKRLDRAAE